jgi:glycosyltransferase involved in cell wall biosynthesis
VTHLSQLLRASDPQSHGIKRVTVWTCAETAAQLPDHPWLTKRVQPWMASGLLRRIVGQHFQLPKAMLHEDCDVAFFPGGTVPSGVHLPAVTMSQNMLPFEHREAARFGHYSAMSLKLRLLRQAQGRSFAVADGVIFLTRYAQDTVTDAIGGLSGSTALIPHGIEERFLLAPRPQRHLTDFSAESPFRVLYVSILMPYKHQVEVALAATQMRASGVPIELRFIGAQWGDYGERFRRLIDELDPKREFLRWNGAEPFVALHNAYQSSDAFVFASSCENLPNILIEAMAAGLPIACSNRGPMPETLGEAGVYFDPEIPGSIAAALTQLVRDATLRADLAKAAWVKATDFSWERCAGDTLAFIAQVARERQHEPKHLTPHLRSTTAHK